MVQKGDGWEIDLHLNPGKYVYRFVVDDKWMDDPVNELKEQNEYGEYNSIVWVE